jgi:hypothetical protein
MIAESALVPAENGTYSASEVNTAEEISLSLNMSADAIAKYLA